MEKMLCNTFHIMKSFSLSLANLPRAIPQSPRQKVSLDQYFVTIEWFSFFFLFFLACRFFPGARKCQLQSESTRNEIKSLEATHFLLSYSVRRFFHPIFLSFTARALCLHNSDWTAKKKEVERREMRLIVSNLDRFFATWTLARFFHFVMWKWLKSKAKVKFTTFFVCGCRRLNFCIIGRAHTTWKWNQITEDEKALSATQQSFLAAGGVRTNPFISFLSFYVIMLHVLFLFVFE